MKRKCLALITALVLMFTALPCVASAAKASSILTAGGNICLDRDLVLKDSIALSKDTVLDLNGHTIDGYSGDGHPSVEFIPIITISPGTTVSIKNGTLEDIRLRNDGHIPSLDSLTINTPTGYDVIVNYGTMGSILRCTMTTLSRCVTNLGDIDLIYDSSFQTEKWAAVQNQNMVSDLDADGVNTIGKIDHCLLTSHGSGDNDCDGLSNSAPGGPILVEDSILLGFGTGGIYVNKTAVTARNCTIINPCDRDSHIPRAIATLFLNETPKPVLENCTLIGLYACGGILHAPDGSGSYVEHAEMTNCTFLPLSQVKDLSPYLKWKMESVHSAAEGGLANFTRVNVYTPGQFSDLSESYWGTAGAARAYELGLMQGTGSGFDPEGNVSLAQAVTMAARLHSIYHTGTESFAPASGAWYQTYVDYAAANGILTTGFADYNCPAKRHEFAAILAAALPAEALEAINTVETIPDVAHSHPNGSAIYALYRAGILTGSDAAGSFLPDTPINRAAAAVIITRMADQTARMTLTLGAAE